MAYGEINAQQGATHGKIREGKIMMNEDRRSKVKVIIPKKRVEENMREV